MRCFVKFVVVALLLLSFAKVLPTCSQEPAKKAPQQLFGAKDWPQLGGSAHRNNAVSDADIPTEWDVKTGKNIKWSVPIGSHTYGNIVVANNQVYVGTNNGNAYLERYPASFDLGVLLAFRESDGNFRWQYSSEKLPQGLIHDWPMLGICSAPIVEGDRLWFVSNRGEVVCLDTEGFYDAKDDGLRQNIIGQHEADVVWRFDMMAELGVRQHNMATCAPTIWGDALFVCTSNGVDETHLKIMAPDAPSFVAFNKNTAEVLWTDNSPGNNILHGQWSCPAVGTFDGVPQVLFPGGDGWLYSFRADRWQNGKPELLWKFDGNLKDSTHELGGRGTRCEIIAVPVIYEGLIYVAMGQDPEHGDGPGCLWCLDPTKRGDVSSQLLLDQNGQVAPPQRDYDPKAGYTIGENPNSAAVWRYTGKLGKDFATADAHEIFHRTLSSASIQNDILMINDLSGFTHCLDAKSGELFWTCDLLAACWTTPLIAGNHVLVNDEDGEIAVFELSKEPRDSLTLRGDVAEPTHQIVMDSASYTAPVVANNVLYIAERKRLYAISANPPARIVK